MPISLTCPVCSLKFQVLGAHDPSETVGATMDCPNCDVVLIGTSTGVRMLHEHLHAQDPRWPKDGAGTQHVDMEIPHE